MVKSSPKSCWQEVLGVKMVSLGVIWLIFGSKAPITAPMALIIYSFLSARPGGPTPLGPPAGQLARGLPYPKSDFLKINPAERSTCLVDSAPRAETFRRLCIEFISARYQNVSPSLGSG